MNQCEPEPNKWFTLKQEEAEEEESSSEEEDLDLDESMDFGTCNKWGSLYLIYIFSCITNSSIKKFCGKGKILM